MQVTREGICNVVLLPGEPLTVTLDVAHEEVSVMSSRIDRFLDLNFIVVFFS